MRGRGFSLSPAGWGQGCVQLQQALAAMSLQWGKQPLQEADLGRAEKTGRENVGFYGLTPFLGFQV